MTELVLKRNKMLFGQKSEKAKFINDGQLAFEGIFNEAEAESDNSASEPTTDTVVKKQGKTGLHRGRKEIRADLETKKIVYELPQEQQILIISNPVHTVFHPITFINLAICQRKEWIITYVS
nr:transposase [Ruminococcus flavefaciens]